MTVQFQHADKTWEQWGDLSYEQTKEKFLSIDWERELRLLSETMFERGAECTGSDEVRKAKWCSPLFAVTESDITSGYGDISGQGVFCHAAAGNNFSAYSYSPMKTKGFLGREKTVQGISIFKHLTADEVLLLVRCFYEEQYEAYDQLDAKHYDYKVFMTDHLIGG